MNGSGWVCDECGKTEVVAGDSHFSDTAPPVGWYLVVRSSPGRGRALRPLPGRGLRAEPDRVSARRAAGLRQRRPGHGRRDLPSLLATVDALDAYSLSLKRPVTVPLVREWLQPGL